MTHLGTVNYTLPTLCTTIQQHTKRSLAHEHLLHVFEMEQIIERQMKAHVFLCFDKDIYVGLKQPRIGYSNITTARLFKYLYAEYGEKTEKLHNKALDYLEEEVDITGPSIKPSFQARKIETIPPRHGTGNLGWDVHQDMLKSNQKIQLHQQSRPYVVSTTTC